MCIQMSMHTIDILLRKVTRYMTTVPHTVIRPFAGYIVYDNNGAQLAHCLDSNNSILRFHSQVPIFRLEHTNLEQYRL